MIPACSALPPSIPTRIGRVVSRPRSSRSVTTVVFSVLPSTSPKGYLVPSMPIPNATTHRCSPKWTPSIINATRSRLPSGAASSSPRAVSVSATNRRETADLLADRFEPDRVTATRQAAEHLAHRHPAQDLAAAEQVIGRHGHFTATGGTHPRPLDADSTPAQSDRAALTTVTHRCALWVVFAARSARLGDVGLHQRAHHLQAGADSEGEQALAHVIGDVAHRYRHFIRYGEPWPGTRLRRVLLVFVGHGGPLLGGVLADAQHLPHRWGQAGGRPSNSTRPGTTSICGGLGATLRPWAV